MNMKFTYSDDWHREGCIFQKQLQLRSPIYYRHVYRKTGELAGVIVDYETADDCHFELTAEDWERFCDRYLHGTDEEQALREFMTDHDGWYAFEYALRSAGIEFKKIVYY